MKRYFHMFFSHNKPHHSLNFAIIYELYEIKLKCENKEKKKDSTLKDPP